MLPPYCQRGARAVHHTYGEVTSLAGSGPVTDSSAHTPADAPFNSPRIVDLKRPADMPAFMTPKFVNKK
jgi:hypothetical protein